MEDRVKNNIIGLATHIDEYVPKIIPIRSIMERVFSTSPPKKTSGRIASMVLIEVRKVLLSVSLILILTI